MERSRKKLVIGVMGGGHISKNNFEMARELGGLIAENGWILLNGGRDAGIMRASAEGAKSKGGLTIGILPGISKEQSNPYIDIPIITGMSDARNLINVLSSDIIVACPGSAGTISEVALALKNGKHVILLQFDLRNTFPEFVSNGLLTYAGSPHECIYLIHSLYENV